MKQRISAKRRKYAAKAGCPYVAQVELPKGYEEHYKDFQNGDTVVVLGEIEQMPGHCVVVLKDGRTLFGYHTDNFRKLTKEEA